MSEILQSECFETNSDSKPPSDILSQKLPYTIYLLVSVHENAILVYP